MSSNVSVYPYKARKSWYRPYRTRAYVVYPENYKPGLDKFYYEKTLKKAKIRALSLGSGTKIYYNIEKYNADKYKVWTEGLYIWGVVL